MSVAEAPPKRSPESARESRPDPSLQTAHTPTRELSRVPNWTPSSPPSRQLESGRSPHRNWAATVSLAVLVLLLITALTVVVARPLRPFAPVGVPNPLRSVGTLISSGTPRTNRLEVRTAAGQVITISTAGKKLVSADGYPLAVSSFRLGDMVSETSGAGLVDGSQSRVSVLGRVAISPEPDGTVMTVQLTPTRSILVDIDGTTQINGTFPSARSLMSVEEADQVRIVGFLDTTLGEVTQTSAIDRIGLAGAAGLQ